MLLFLPASNIMAKYRRVQAVVDSAFLGEREVRCSSASDDVLEWDVPPHLVTTPMRLGHLRHCRTAQQRLHARQLEAFRWEHVPGNQTVIRLATVVAEARRLA